MIASLFALASAQAAYGPPVPVSVDRTSGPQATRTGNGPSDFEAMLRAQGLSEAGLQALRDLPLSTVAKGATRAAQCTVDQLARRDPLPLDEMASALEERDATAAAQAQETTRYLIAALGRLQPADQRILLAVIGTGANPVGGPPPPRLDGARRAGGPPPGGPPGGFGGGGGQGFGGPPPGGREPAGRQGGRSPQSSPSGMAMPSSLSACEQMLNG